MFLNILFFLVWTMAEFPTVGSHCTVEFCKQLGIERTFYLISEFKISKYLPSDRAILFYVWN